MSLKDKDSLKKSIMPPQKKNNNFFSIIKGLVNILISSCLKCHNFRKVIKKKQRIISVSLFESRSLWLVHCFFSSVGFTFLSVFVSFSSCNYLF